MTSKTKSSVAIHRARKARQGFVRVEVNVRKEDASLIAMLPLLCPIHRVRVGRRADRLQDRNLGATSPARIARTRSPLTRATTW